VPAGLTHFEKKRRSKNRRFFCAVVAAVNDRRCARGDVTAATSVEVRERQRARRPAVDGYRISTKKGKPLQASPFSKSATVIDRRYN
jgi:hypothetical protein